ncbi:sulfite exporter TauE/SafE family protein [Aestuariivirga sp.]|uniref:sulfite exporter TauE/SafE family protein n=1 Tax=Aestuariivirga sp. TaxID=2650926 RepID=UPI0035945842
MDSWVYDFIVFAGVGFFAQLIDGALGMGYGVISATVLLATGVPPAHTSASVHAAKLFTTAASGTSHILHGNVDKRILIILCIAGSIGGILGAMVLVNVAAGAIRPFVFGYLGIMGLVIIWRGLMFPSSKTVPGKYIAPLGAAGGFLDAIGGGGWGPVVTSSLIGAGASPRFVVGTVNAAEFVVTCAVVSAFAATIFLGVWAESNGIMDHFTAIMGLILGGLPAAFFAGWLLKVAPRKPLMIAVGLLICSIAGFELSRAIF